MKNVFKLLLGLLLAWSTASAQQTQKEQIKLQAGLIITAIQKNDFVAVIKSMPPGIIQKAGGEKLLLSAMKKGLNEMKSQGAAIDSAEIGEPGDIIRSQQVLYSLVPEKIFMHSNATKFYGSSSLLAISMDNGKKWYFVDVGRMTPTQLKSLFPTVYNKLSIPEQTRPVVTSQ